MSNTEVILTGKPGFELSRNMHLHYAFGSHIYSFSSMNTYVTYFTFCIDTNNFGNCTNMCILPWSVLSWQSQIFYICRPYLSFHIYYPLSIPCLAVIFAFYKCLWCFFLKFTNISHLAAIFVLSHLWPLMDSLFGWHISFPYLCQYLLKLYKHVYIQNTNAQQRLSWQPQILTFV